MRLLKTSVVPSPERADTLRVAADIVRDGDSAALHFWFDVPQSHGERLSRSGNPWLLLMVPMAMAAGEDIHLSLPVDPLLAENIRGLMKVWHGWFPELKPAAIHAPATAEATPSAGHRGLFFSAGVDSFFTLLRHHETVTGAGTGPLDTLIFIGGFDLPLSEQAEVDSAQKKLRDVAREIGKAFLPVITNLREPETPYKYNWILSHGCALAAVGHLFDGEFGELLIASSYEYGNLMRIGSHPMTDPLLSSRSLRVVHDGASYSRPDKVRQIGLSDVALRNLRVCYAAKRHTNCSRCSKCLFTMAMLDIFGYVDRASSFDWSAYKLESIAGLFLDQLQMHRVAHLIKTARATPRHELAAALQHSLNRSRKIWRAISTVRRLPVLWRFEYQLRAFLLRFS